MVDNVNRVQTTVERSVPRSGSKIESDVSCSARHEGYEGSIGNDTMKFSKGNMIVAQA